MSKLDYLCLNELLFSHLSIKHKEQQINALLLESVLFKSFYLSIKTSLTNFFSVWSKIKSRTLIRLKFVILNMKIESHTESGHETRFI